MDQKLLICCQFVSTYNPGCISLSSDCLKTNYFPLIWQIYACFWISICKNVLHYRPLKLARIPLTGTTYEEISCIRQSHWVNAIMHACSYNYKWYLSEALLALLCGEFMNFVAKCRPVSDTVCRARRHRLQAGPFCTTAKALYRISEQGQGYFGHVVVIRLCAGHCIWTRLSVFG